MTILENFAKRVCTKFESAKPDYAPPHPTIFSVAKSNKLRVAIDGEFQETRDDWCDEIIDEGVDDTLRVDVYRDTSRLGTVVFTWNNDETLSIKKIIEGRKAA